jgi:hypothetical protein
MVSRMRIVVGTAGGSRSLREQSDALVVLPKQVLLKQTSKPAARFSHVRA